MSWHYRLDGKGAWLPLPGPAHRERLSAQRAAEEAADAAHAGEVPDEDDEGCEVEVRDPNGQASRWRVEAEVTVEWGAQPLPGPWAAERCACGHRYELHGPGGGCCRYRLPRQPLSQCPCRAWTAAP